MESTPDLVDTIDWGRPLLFIVRGDGYPTAGAEWANLTISLTNVGQLARSPAFVWLIGLGAGLEKDMDGLAIGCASNVEVKPHFFAFVCPLETVLHMTFMPYVRHLNFI